MVTLRTARNLLMSGGREVHHFLVYMDDAWEGYLRAKWSMPFVFPFSRRRHSIVSSGEIPCANVWKLLISDVEGR